MYQCILLLSIYLDILYLQDLDDEKQFQLQPTAFKDYLDGLFSQRVQRAEDAPKINRKVLREFYTIAMKRRYFALGEETAAREKKELLELQGQEIPLMTNEENQLV